MPIQITTVDTDTGAETEVAQIIGVYYRRGRTAVIEVGLYVSQAAMDAGKLPSSVQTTTLSAAALAALEAQMEPALELSVLATPTFSTGTQVARA